MPIRRFRVATVALLIAASALPATLVAQDRPGAAQAPIPEDLPDRHRAFLEMVAPLLSAREREAFLALRQEYQRDAFMRRFWEVRDPFPQTPGNELQIAWEERAKLARERFGNLSAADIAADDRFRMLLINGPPVEFFEGRCSGQIAFPLEIWSYPGTDRIKGAFNLVFVSRTGNPKGPYRLWYPSEGAQSLLGFEVRDRAQMRHQEALQTIAENCIRGHDIAGRLAGAIDWNQVQDKVLPRPDEEWLAAFLASSTEVPAGAPTFPARLDVAYPARAGSRTVVQGLVTVPKGEVAPMQPITTGTAPAAKAPEPFYSFLVDGEILREGELFDHFRYRFNVPVGGAPLVPGAAADVLPLVFQRNLRPGVYTLVLKVEDLAAKRFFQDRRELEVPMAPTPPVAPPVVVAEGGADAPAPSPAAATPAALAEANAAIRSDDHTIRILAPPQDLLTGRVRVDATTQGEGISKVTFELNGRPVLTKGKPPFSVELNLGDQPRTHRLRALALGAAGQTLAEDELMLNAGPHRFSVRLVEPQRGKTYRQSVRAQAVVEVPEGETLDRVEIFLNDTAVATLYQAPFVQPLLIPQGQDLTYVRAVAYLEGGSFSEDLVMVNRPDYGAEVDVQLVELYTAVVDRKGRPVPDVPREAFTVTEDGVRQEILRFERVENLPIYAGLMIDNSISMAEELDDAIKGGLRFFEKVITPKDRAAVITFNNRPTLAVRFTNQDEVLAGSLQGLTAEGETAIYDSLIFALHYFGGVKGKRAIILITDGEDSRSKYQFEEALDYARRSGVTIYPVGINLASRNTGIRMKLDRLADETGGRTFMISGAKELERVYAIVEEELRSQLLIAYQSSKEGNDGKFRTVEVKVSRPGTAAKTVRGYYP